MHVMRLVGGRRTWGAAALAVVVSIPLLAGCTNATDLGRTAQTQLNRIDQVTSSDVTVPTWDNDTTIAVTYEDIDDTAGLAALLADIDEVATDQGYSTYRLELTSASLDDSVLVVDQNLTGSPDEKAVLDNWYAVTGTMLGPVTYEVHQDDEAITISSGGGAAHDIAAAADLGYGGDATTWTFRSGDSSFVATGAVAPGDVDLFQDVSRTVGSESLAASARSWQLDRRDDHVRLDLDVTFRDGPVAPAELTVDSHGSVIAPLAEAALATTSAAGVPVWLSLTNSSEAAADDPDVFGVWSSSQAPARGRDRLHRGWDVWWSDLARRRA